MRTPTTPDLLASYSDSRLKVYRNAEAVPAVPNWAIALQKCSGGYIAAMHSVDIMYPERLEKQCAMLDAPSVASRLLDTVSGMSGATRESRASLEIAGPPQWGA